MEHQIIEKSLKPTKEKCSQLSTNSQLLSNYSNLLKKQAFVGQSFVQIEQLRTLSSNAKEILLYHGILNDKNEVKDDQNDIVISNFLKNYDYGNLSQSHLAKLREIQYVWMELHKCIRFIYKNAIASTPCVVFNEKIPDAITNAIKQFSRRLCEEDCQQLFIRLEVLLKDFVLEARDQLNLHHNVKDLPRTYLKCLLASYGAFCVAADNLAPCMPQFNSLLMKRFSVSLQLLNKYLFHTCLYADAFVQNNVPYYISQLKTLSPEAYFTNQELIHSFIAFDDEMADIASKWYDVKRMILEFSRERVLSNSKQSVLLEDWEVYKENRELATTKIWQFRSFKRDLAEFDVQLLSLLDDITNHISDLRLNPISKTNGIKSCKNCIMKSFCLCDDCDNRHIVTYLDTPPASPIQDINYTTGNSQILQKYNAMSKEKEEKSLVLEKKINDIIAPRTLLKFIPDKLITNSIAEIKTIEELDEEPVDIVQTNIILPDMPVTDNAAILTTDIPPVIETTIVHKTATEKESPKQSSLKQSNHNVNTKKKLKSDLSCKNTETQSTTKANKENKHCDCPHCEVFESTNGSSLSKNRTRDRLRLRLNEKQSKANKEKITTKQTVEKVESNVEIKVLDGKTKKVETKAGKVEVKPGKVETKTEKAEIKTGKVETKMGKVETKPKVEVKAGKMIEIKSDKTNKLKVNSQQKEKIEATNNVPDVDTRNIRDLINFIEGIDLNAQLINAQKKAAKKARRREKKLEEERLKQEELDRIATEKAREEERKLKERLMKSQPVHHNNSKKGHKNHDKIAKHTKNHKHQTKSEKKPVVVQPTPVTKPIVTEIKHVGPMVTIKRVMECTNSEPTVTITLKGSTPDKDKLLYTLVNGQTDLGKTVEEITSPKIESNSQNNNNTNKNNNINVNNTSNNNNNSINSKKKNKKSKRDQTKVVPPNLTTTTELINNNSNNSLTITKKQKNNKTQAPPPQQEKVIPHPKLKEQKTLLINIPKSAKDTVTITAIPDAKKPTSEVQSPTKTTAKPSESSLNLHMLRLPPGITITKVDGPTVPRKVQNPKPNPPVMSVQSSPLHKTENRSGVIVVDTVKLKETQPIGSVAQMSQNANEMVLNTYKLQF